jgi:DNA polymerase III subunit gamma/tau
MFGTEFRPLNFDSVLGLDNIKEILSSALTKSMVDPAYLFVGSLSSGKTTLARIFARSILCNDRGEDGSPCNECSSCSAFLSDRNPGYTEIDAANNSSKDRVKELFESLRYESVSKTRIVLFDECHNLSKEAKDALLKETEDPIDNVVYLFCTTDVDKMPGTLRSRCIELQLNQPTESDVQKKLAFICDKEKIEFDEDALHMLASSSGRFYRFAENKLRTVSYLGEVSVENVNKVSPIYVEEISNMVVSLSFDLNESLRICDFLITRMNVKMLYESILKLIVDSIKFSSGISTDSPFYNGLIKKISSQYGDALYEILDYIISKNRFTDITMLQSDILVMHYKFLRDQFAPKEPVIRKKPVSESTEKKPPENKSDGPRSLNEIANLPNWKREEAVRNIVQKQRRERKDNRVDENFSKACGPEVVDKVPKSARKTLTPEEFRKNLGGKANGGKV